MEEQGIFIDAIARVGRYTQGDQALVKANAAIISSSPDLLAALKMARARMDEYIPEIVKDWGSTKSEFKLIDEVIAKATGQEQD